MKSIEASSEAQSDMVLKVDQFSQSKEIYYKIQSSL